LLCVLSSKRKNIYDDVPARLNTDGFAHTDVGDAGDNKVLDGGARMHIIKHNLLEWFKKVLLKVERHEVFLQQEFISQLSETVNREDSHVLVWVGADPNELLREHSPDLTPHEADPRHV